MSDLIAPVDGDGKVKHRKRQKENQEIQWIKKISYCC